MVAATSLIDSAAETFERLFVREYRRVAGVAFKITADAAEAEDIAQEAFVRCARRRALDAERAQAWVYRAAVHLALNAVRSRRRRIRREQRDYALGRSLQSAADPQDVLEQDERRALARAALRRLKPRDAELLALRYGGLSYREIAAVLQIDAAQIGTRLARAERAFKKEIDREALG